MTTATPRRIYRTAQIKPATRDAIKDVLAQAADEIIRLRTRQAEAETRPPLWMRIWRGTMTLGIGA